MPTHLPLINARQQVCAASEIFGICRNTNSQSFVTAAFICGAAGGRLCTVAGALKTSLARALALLGMLHTSHAWSFNDTDTVTGHSLNPVYNDIDITLQVP